MKIPHNKPTLDKSEIQAVEEVIKSGWIVQGERVKEFENLICRFANLPDSHAVAVSNGTSALYLALKVLEVGVGDEVIIPTYVCSALLNAVNMVGSKAVLADVEEQDFNIDRNQVFSKINGNTKAIIVPHIFGVPADIIEIKKLGIPLIEDCAQALGAKVYDKNIGVFGDIAVFSFYATKVITTGQGGMLVSNDPKYVEKAKDYINFDCRENYYPRFNFQMTDIQAAMGIAQFSKLETFLEKRRIIAEGYKSVCQKKGWNFQAPKSEDFIQNWYRFVLNIEPGYLGKLKEFLKSKDVGSIIPIENWELLHYYLKLDPDEFKTAESLSKSALSLPIYPELVDNGGFERILELLRWF